MSQPPLSYASPIRPTSVTVLATLGIIFGGLGVICLGFGELMGLFSLANPRMFHVLGQPMSRQIGGLVLGLYGLALSGVLLFASIGSLALKPLARRVMIGWAIVSIPSSLLRLLFEIFISLPRISQNPVFQNRPNSQQMVAVAKIAALVGGLTVWLLWTTYCVLVIVFFPKPQIVASFEQPPVDPSAM